ncbi:unnamed protein product [Clavelina lepadiformis]|uniref:Uncharacterized protein n=1 Tax=Clavelina lepadiformis TaxID=159417 RepID=A0ABP0H1P2_CLALP
MLQWFLLHLLLLQSCSSSFTIKASATRMDRYPRFCPTLKISNETCRSCINVNSNISLLDETPISSLLKSYLDYEQIKMKPHIFTPAWTYNNETVVEDDFILMSIYSLDESDNMTLQPLERCCGVPLPFQTCPDQEIIPQLNLKKLYYSLTLFSSTVVKEEEVVFPTEFVTHESPLDIDENHSPSLTLSTSSEDIFQRVLTQKIDNAVEDKVVEEWLNYTRYIQAEKYSYVCLFELPKENITVNATNELDSFNFKRGVYDMTGFLYKQYEIYYSPTQNSINCTSKTFNGTNIYNVTSSNPNNETFTCMALWLSVNTSNREIKTKCMPHNKTYVPITKTFDDYRNPENSMLILIVTISSVGGSIAIFLILVGIIRCKHHLIKMKKSNKELPYTLKRAFQDLKDDETEVKYSEAETATAYDQKERAAIDKMILNDKNLHATCSLQAESKEVKACNQNLKNENIKDISHNNLHNIYDEKYKQSNKMVSVLQPSYGEKNPGTAFEETSLTCDFDESKRYPCQNDSGMEIDTPPTCKDAINDYAKVHDFDHSSSYTTSRLSIDSGIPSSPDPTTVQEIPCNLGDKLVIPTSSNDFHNAPATPEKQRLTDKKSNLDTQSTTENAQEPYGIIGLQKDNCGKAKEDCPTNISRGSESQSKVSEENQFDASICEGSKSNEEMTTLNQLSKNALCPVSSDKCIHSSHFVPLFADDECPTHLELKESDNLKCGTYFCASTFANNPCQQSDLSYESHSKHTDTELPANKIEIVENVERTHCEKSLENHLHHTICPEALTFFGYSSPDTFSNDPSL